ncbi:MAG TPA: hypothetical protein PKA42_03010 [Candidatus Paceibacterota bacterium]|nr:hypothetical protein [Candidatus Paceibacterota bacterium]HMO83115.1 hypothetical protein [Candidatus Paceibacterota bacterium]
MRKNREIIALLLALILGSLLLSFLIGIALLSTFVYLATAILVIYLGKYFWHSPQITKNPVLGFPTRELWYVFFGSQILKTVIVYVLVDFLYSLLSIGLVEWLVMALEVVSFGALIILFSKLTIKIIPR